MSTKLVTRWQLPNINLIISREERAVGLANAWVITMAGARSFNSLLARRFRGRNFLGDISGTTAIEFAMISVPFIGLIGAVFETGSAYFRASQLQAATETASRGILTHSLTDGLTYQQFIDQYVCTWQTGQGVVQPGTLGRMFDCSQLKVEIDTPTSWSTANSYASNSFNPPARTQAITFPARGSVAIIRVVYPMSSYSFMLGGSAVGAAGIKAVHGDTPYMLMGIAAFKVEP